MTQALKIMVAASCGKFELEILLWVCPEFGTCPFIYTAGRVSLEIFWGLTSYIKTRSHRESYRIHMGSFIEIPLCEKMI